MTEASSTESQGAEGLLLRDPIAYWENRHARYAPWAVGGDRGLSEAENYEFYVLRMGRIVELIRRHAGAERPLRILDAGCGRGHVTNALRRCGHRVVGLDASATAIRHATEQYGEGFVQCELHQLRPPRLFDVIVCLDVLFHVLDDRSWLESVRAFGRYASSEAIVVLTDAFAENRYTKGDYIVHRDAAIYDEAFEAMDFRRVATLPYRFGHNPNVMATYSRRIAP